VTGFSSTIVGHGRRKEIAMGRHEIIELAMQLEPAERFEVAEELLRSVEQVDPEIDRLWLEEAERRLAAHRAGRVKGVPAEDIFGTF
jgi:putative addiction module component (TIGR02574 family)